MASIRPRQRGFTLLELMVVLVIAVLLVAVAPPLLSGLSGATELRGAARQLAAGLRFARNEAVTRQREATLTLDLAQHRFAVSGDPREISLPDTLALQLHTAQSELWNHTTGNIRFFPDGSSTGGAITVSGPKRAYRVNVDWLTGGVAIVEQDVP
ncbi:MAG: GspH/FimT family pseudopilin [Candidatus Competibacteraceae bacterium]|nr:GspH/FimT family pseudopilin [Candidatus Competibacteraceae bacterium]MBK7983799.1 GspH/FimT family pseudopilin [Candidatus Competibacteraceae bacterium]MBK8897660.1 GspH/FimT family pseudopilin [Candidatus Competibacteraceae bacterium]MBK8963805.1 GspH/FimT family pseudopilin [Candidatus Competibacteraceae bacterium]